MPLKPYKGKGSDFKLAIWWQPPKNFNKNKGVGWVWDVIPVSTCGSSFWFSSNSSLLFLSPSLCNSRDRTCTSLPITRCPYVYPKSRDISCVQIGSEFYRLIGLKQWINKNDFVSFGRMTRVQYLRSLFFYIYICKAFLNGKGCTCVVRARTFTGEGKQFQKWIIFFALLFLPRQRSIVLRDIYFHNQYVPKLYLNHFTLYYIFNNYRMCLFIHLRVPL